MIESYLNQMRNIHFAKECIEKVNGSEDIYKVALATGYPGISLLFYEMYIKTGNMSYYYTCHKYLEESINIISSNPLYSSSLFEGSFGIIFALTTCSNNGENYQKIVFQLLDSYIDIFEKQHKNLKELIANQNYSMYNFDLITGISGTLLTLIHVYDTYKITENHFKIYEIINKITNILEQILEKFNTTNNSKNELLENLGMSHGIVGIINTLASSYKRGFGNGTLKTELYNSFFKLKNLIKIDNGLRYMPFTTNDSEFYRDAWCYGSPGVSICLNNLGTVLGQFKMKEFAKFLLRETFFKNEEMTKLVSPTICHGYSGILIISNILKEIGLQSKYKKKIENEKVEKSNIPYKDYSYEEISDNFSYLDDVGLLTGCSGVYLSLLFLEGPYSKWYKMLAMS